MPYYVIGDDKGFEEAYSKQQVDTQITSVNNQISTANSNISTLQTNVNNLTSQKQNKITSGTAAPSGGSNGDIYIQY